MSTPRASVSVRDLVGFLLRSGDLERRSADEAALAVGMRAHDPEARRLQAGYEPEVGLGVAFPSGEAGLATAVRIAGRADGVITGADGVVLEEIKSTSRSLQDIRRLREPDPTAVVDVFGRPGGDPGGRLLDWAQALCYAAMLCSERGLDEVRVRLRYVEAATGESLLLHRSYPASVLSAYLTALARRYAVWVHRAEEWERARDDSMTRLGSPFRRWRSGQEELADAVRTAVENGERLFAQAPTGTGKTMAVLLPALRCLGSDGLKRLFYLTPRGTTAGAPLRALGLLSAGGARLRTITLTAKEKSCLAPGAECLPAFCPFARGHYDRVLGALEDLLAETLIDADVVERCARRHTVCPHELALDASEWCDVIIGDVNYVFDPRACLRRYQDPARPAALEQLYLVDEAHNLLDRAREMYSAELAADALEAVARETEVHDPALSESARALRDALPRVAEECDEASDPTVVGISRAPPSALAAPLEAFAEAAERTLGDPLRRVDPTVFDVLYFRRVMEWFDSRYATVVSAGTAGLRVRLSCLDPAQHLDRRLAWARASVLFSATLTPLEYYVAVLGGGERASTLSLPSPFPRRNLCVLVDRSVSTRYRDRPTSLARVTATVAAAVRARAGSYLIFAPSYEYLGRIHDAFRSAAPEIRTMVQRVGMAEGERRDFLAELEAGGPLAGFAVMGGLFGEAVDLPGEALSGVVIIGLGLPQPGAERDLIRSAYDERCDQGFSYAYAYPGIARVLQAAGRVIRSETDRGTVVLVDERFCQTPYRELLPPWWDVREARGAPEVARVLGSFWE